MAQTTDYEIANSSGLVFRGRVNEVLAAVQSSNSGTTAPTDTAAGMLWFDTSVTPAILRRRNAADSAWIDVYSTEDLASQAEAEAGTNNTKLMTALRTKQAIDAQVSAVSSMTLLGTLTTTSGSIQTLSSLTLTSYKQLMLEWTGVSHNSGSTQSFSIGAGLAVTGASASDTANGISTVSLVSGISTSVLSRSGSLPSIPSPQIAQTGYSTATTSVSVSVSGGSFDGGSVRVYGVK